MYLEDYKYWLAYKKNKTSYYRCARYKTLCPGRCVVQNSKVRSCTPHNHPPEPDLVLVDKFRKVLTHRAASETVDLYSIYWEEASQRHSDAALLYTFTAAESAMRKARRKQLPKAPNTIEELADILENSTLFRIHSRSSRDPFYQAKLTLEDGACIIFAHMKTLEAIGQVEELQMNLTLSSPATPTTPAYNLLIIHAVQAYQNVPIIYTIMTSKSQAGYAAVFAYIRENWSTYIVPSTVMSDYCPEIQSALALTFPEASIKGYWFHYTEAVLEYVKRKEIQRETDRSHGSSGLRMLLVLPLLPAEYMAPGIESIRKWASEKMIYTPAFTQLCDYVEQSWLRAIGAGKMSIFGLPHGVYNHIQSLNKEINSSLNSSNPVIWNILESITTIAVRTFVKCNKRVKSFQSKQPNKSQQVLDTIIKNATQLWIRTPVHLRNPLQFLQLASHCINDTVHYRLDDGKAASPKNRSFSMNSMPPASTTNIIRKIAVLPTIPPRMPKLVKSDEHDKLKITSEKSKSKPQSPLRITIDTPIMIEHEETTMSHPTDTMLQNDLPRTLPSSEPPPLAFFSKTVIRKPIIFSATEPPPLVPIRFS